MDSVSEYFDNHTIFVSNLGPASFEQLNKAISNYFKLCSTKLNKPQNFWGNWKINVVGNGVTYHVISGNNMNDSEYLIWEQQEDEFLSSNLDLSSPSVSSSTDSAWEEETNRLLDMISDCKFYYGIDNGKYPRDIRNKHEYNYLVSTEKITEVLEYIKNNKLARKLCGIDPY